MHIATVSATTIDTTEAEGIKVKLSRNVLMDVELNQSELGTFTLSRV